MYACLSPPPTVDPPSLQHAAVSVHVDVAHHFSAKLDESELETLARNFSVADFGPSKIIFANGTNPEFLALVLDGDPFGFDRYRLAVPCLACTAQCGPER